MRVFLQAFSKLSNISDKHYDIAALTPHYSEVNIAAYSVSNETVCRQKHNLSQSYVLLCSNLKKFSEGLNVNITHTCIHH